MADLSHLHAFLASHPTIRHATPEDNTYSALRASFLVDEDLKPPLIVQPSCADHVASLVSVCSAHRIPFTVRAGGHDLLKRTFAADAVTIDLRALASVQVDHASRTARIGGGILVRDQMAQLGRENLATACGNVSPVGYVGWAIHGGYGILSPSYGMGADQIVGAKVVTATGRSSRPINVLGGLILYGSPDQPLKTTITQFNDGYRKLAGSGLPPALATHQLVMNCPQGRTMGLFFLWASSDLEAGEHWRERICSLAPVSMDTITSTTLPAWLDATATALPSQCYGSIFSLNIRALTSEVVDVITSHVKHTPSDCPSMLSIHELRAGSATTSFPDSVFPLRIPHFMFEIFPGVETPERVESVMQWARDFHNALRRTNPENILPGTYLPFATWGEVSTRDIFLEEYDTLAELKREYDPGNVFRYALAQI